MEHLASYLNGKKKGEFAKSVGVSPAYLSQILSGHRRPGLDLALRIERATEGAVPVYSWSSEHRSSSVVGPSSEASDAR